MEPDRRYSESEIAAIFEQAARAQEAARDRLSTGEGLTLAELQEIGREAGITPEFVERAAVAVDRTSHSSPPPRLLGLPVGASYSVDLPGAMSDADWERLVADLRETFQAVGRVRHDGSLRQWSNGNLKAFVEPGEAGHRLRLITQKGDAPTYLVGGIVALVMGITLAAAMFVAGDIVAMKLAMLMLISIGGLGSVAFSAYHLPRWAEQRKAQMEGIAARAVERAGSPLLRSEETTITAALDLEDVDDQFNAGPVPSRLSTRA